MKRFAFSTLFVAIIGYALPGIAQTTVYDGFNYGPAGSAITGFSGGGDTGFSGAWFGSTSSAYTIAAGSLSAPELSLPTSGNMVSTTAASARKLANRDLQTPIGTPGTTEYISFLLEPTGTLNQGQHDGYFGIELSGTGESLFVGKPGNFHNPNLYDVEGSGGVDPAFTDVQPVVGQTVFMVLEANFTAGDDTFSLFIDPGSTQPAVPDAVNSQIDVGMVSEIQIDSTGAFNFDELRIGPTYASVVPEPSSLAIVAACLCAGAFCLAFRKRRMDQRQGE